MQLLVSEDTTTPSYWLNWRFLLCALLVLASVLIASFLIWKYEHSGNSESERGETQQEGPRILRYDESWKPCLKEIRPVYLVVYRMIAFCLLLVTLSFDVATSGVEVLLYYTHWTLTLATIYFGVWTFFSFLCSLVCCFLSPDVYSNTKEIASVTTDNLVSELVEEGLVVPLAHGVNEAGVKLPDGLECPGEQHCLRTAGLCGYLFQILFQMTAGAVTITDTLYWTLILLYLHIKDYDLSFKGTFVHTFILVRFTCITYRSSTSYVYHGSFILPHNWLQIYESRIIIFLFPWWWPYPILDLSLEDAPLWYLAVALAQIPCYINFLWAILDIIGIDG
ncbi:Hypothetical predicted protein [Olea europaea subsp. europaea]|uniref:Uncharacterized protein n=1 Tax=Olea europaea subsp. europaea TaxID=158383 RepID=A0A8S0TKQ4_OLEEU|nr:Hypothetical predicted protein [Olea europaea subsp. europaea]